MYVVAFAPSQTGIIDEGRKAELGHIFVVDTVRTTSAATISATDKGITAKALVHQLSRIRVVHLQEIFKCAQ